MTRNHDVDILLVEDNPFDAELAMLALKKNKLAKRLVHLHDGQAALDFIFGRGAFNDSKADHCPRVILLDLKLPKVNGLEVLKIIKGDPVTGMIPVVLLTSSGEESDIEEGYRLGVNSYVVKPVDYDQFTQAVVQLGKYWLALNQTVHSH